MTTFTTHSAGQTIASADINLIQTAVRSLEAKTAAPPAMHGFLGWSFDPSQTASLNTTTTTFPLVQAVYLPDCTVTNLYHYIGVAGTSTHYAMGLYNSAGTLLSQSADATSTASVTGLKTFALGAAQAVTAGYYYIAIGIVASAAPQLLVSTDQTAAIINLSVGTPPIAFRAATSSTSYSTTLPTPVGTLTASNRQIWVAAA